MLSLVNNQSIMTDTLTQSDPPHAEEILEDGEIDDEDEQVIMEETEITEEGGSGVFGKSELGGSQDSLHYATTMNKGDNDGLENEDHESSEEEKRKAHKKHQRKRKKHRESKEKELRALEKKERRRKRKMLHAQEDRSSVERAGSSSPHSRRRKKRKKHSRDRKDSTTPDSDDSVEQYPSGYYGAGGNGYSDEYNEQYSSEKGLISGTYNMNNSSSAYYATTDKNSYQNDGNTYDEESGSDFEAQLAEYQSYKTRGDSVTKDNKATKQSSFERDSKDGNADEMYAEFMEYDENPRRPCKFFAEGKCLKGNECSFSHDQSRVQKSRSKKREMCKYYLAGHCHHGNHCSYMHGEYPCKYFHTGATCYSGDNCRFSHEPPTEETQDIIDHFKDVLSNVDDSWEISELKKLGIKVRPKPPPGVGLLPTPTMPPLTDSHKEPSGTNPAFNIPSIFDITVAPTADFQKRIDENSIASLSMTDESEDMTETAKNQSQPRMYRMGIRPPSMNNGNAMVPTPAFSQNSNLLKGNQRTGGNSGFYDNFYEGEHDANNAEYESGNTGPGFQTDDEFIRIDNSTTTDEDRTEEATVKVPDFLPATQKALFMRIHGKRALGDSENDGKKDQGKDADIWTYSSDEDEKGKAMDPGIIKMDSDVPAAISDTQQINSSSVETLLRMIASKGGGAANLDTNLLSKVASVINMPTSSGPSETYNPASSIATYSPAQTKLSPHQPNTGSQQPQPRERRTSCSTSTSPGHTTKHHRPHPIRRRLSTQELTKEPVVIPLVPRQTGNQPMHSAHPDPRLTLSRLIGVKPGRFSASLPRFSKDLILPSSGKILGGKVIASSEDSKPTKRDPRLGRHKDPRLQRTTDPRLKSRGKSTTILSTPEMKSSTPEKPSALLTKSSAAIPSLPELDLNLAHVNQATKENADTSNTSSEEMSDYVLPNLKLPRLVKAPGASPTQEAKPDSPPQKDKNPPPPTIAPYDPRYMSTATPKSTAPSLVMNTAPYDPRVLSSHSSLPVGMEIKKRTIQLPKLTPAPTYKPNGSDLGIVKPEGDQGDF